MDVTGPLGFRKIYNPYNRSNMSLILKEDKIMLEAMYGLLIAVIVVFVIGFWFWESVENDG